MAEIVFVTHNKGKIESAKRILKDVDLKIFEYDLEEPRSDDISYISRYKVIEAYKLVKRPCISLDCGFGIEGILKLMEGKIDRSCRFTECLSYYDGSNVYQFSGRHEGRIAYRVRGTDSDKKWSDLWYIYMPSGYDKTLAEMSEDEILNRVKYDSVDSIKEFAKWYKST